MARRSSSPQLVGRDDELADLLAAVRSEDSERPVILLAGDAGIGKTRLLAELVGRLDRVAATGSSDRMLVARGSCLRLAEGELPFAPILEVLNAIRRWGPSPPVEAAYDRLAGSRPDAAPSEAARTLRFIEIHDALVATAADAPLLVIVDDLHWADRSTLDLVLFLARRLRGGRVTLLGAYRSDELHRLHPLRPIVAELTRGYVRERIDLGPLGRAAVAEQISALGGAAADGVMEAIVDRADGNPFYVEELVALDPRTPGLPPSVRDVVLARLAALDDATFQILAACAVIGREADAELIRAVVALDAQGVDTALRTAVDHWILVPDPNGRAYRFRHALLEEAVHDDLLPGDRVDLHRSVAAALEAGGGDVTPGELARHLDQSGQFERAIDAYAEAASLALRALAWAEGVAAFERAEELAAAYGGGSKAADSLRSLVIPVAQAINRLGWFGKAIAHLRAWIARTDAQLDTSTAVLLWLSLTKIYNDSGDEAAARTAGEEAERLLPPNETTIAGVELHIHLASKNWMDGEYRTAISHAERAVAGADGLGDVSLLFLALVHRAEVLIASGHVERGFADAERARQLQAQHGFLDSHGHFATNVAGSLTDVGVLEPAREIWEESLRMSRDLGTSKTWDPWNLPGLALIAFHQGRWADADGPIAASRAFQAPGIPTHYNESIAGILAAGRGDLAALDDAIAATEGASEGLEVEFTSARGFMRAARADVVGDPARRLDEAEGAIRVLDGTEIFVFRSRLAVEAASGAADLVASLHPTRDRARIADVQRRARAAADLAVALDDGTAVPGTMSVPWTRANAALAAAEAARAEGRDDPAAWLPIADAFRTIGMLPRVAYVQFRAAAASFAAGDRASGTLRLQEAHALAAAIGMAVLLRRIEELARAARVDVAAAAAAEVAPPPGRPRNPYGLSARELEVLALLADGRTNGEIGARLFISTKTASVHVTHILNKLGVSTRTEAALLASRAGLLEGQLQRAE